MFTHPPAGFMIGPPIWYDGKRPQQGLIGDDFGEVSWGKGLHRCGQPIAYLENNQKIAFFSRLNLV